MFGRQSLQTAGAAFAGGVLVTALALPTGSAADAPDAADGNGVAHGARQHFGDRVAGTWMSGDLPGYAEIVNIGADGTIMFSNNFEYGGGSGAFKQGTTYGAWEQTGRRTMQSVELGFLYDGEGRHNETGLLRVTYTFARDFDSYQAEFVEDVYAADQDPLAPDAVPVRSFGGTVAAERVTVPDAPRSASGIGAGAASSSTFRGHLRSTDAVP